MTSAAMTLKVMPFPALRIHEVFVFAADNNTPFGGGPQIEVR